MSSADDQICDDNEKVESVSNKRLGKRKQFGKLNCDEKKEKLQKCDTDSVFKSPFSTPRKTIENTIKPSSEKLNSSMDPEEISEVLDGMDEEIDHVLVETANKNKLTARNVKNILRHVITNEYVLAMVRNTMKLENSEVDDLDEAPFEPKLTRSKAKELREKQRILPWPVSSPMKQPDVASKQLLEAEFSEESSDEDYKPTEEEVPSEEEEGISSPKSGACESSICESPAVPTVVKSNEEFGDEENNLIIAFEDPEIPSEVSEADKIALRTRSKLCLNATSLEDIEASYVAPDITMDMYDTTCDDEEWQKFLQAVFKSTDSSLMTEVPVEEADDAEDDPEYNVLEDDDMPDEFDLRYDKAVKIPRKELNALMEEILEFDYQGMPDCDEEEDMDISFSESNRTDTPCIPALPVGNDYVENVYSQWMTAEERMLLDEQMRMYVQLLTQSFLLSVGIPELNFLSVTTKLFLDEIKMFADKEVAIGVESAFYSHNLDGALNIVSEYEDEQYTCHRQASMVKKPLCIGPNRIKKTLAGNEVFMYPELLPTCSFHIKFERKKTSFTDAEDNLIALGLEQFSSTSCPVYNIMTLMMPAKNEQQIKIRIKNSRCQKMSLSNPIKFYHVYKVAPTFPRIIRMFDPEKVKAPKDLPPEVLPAWMKPFCTTVTPIAPAAEKNSLTSPTFDTPPPSKRKYCPILPRGLHFSPLKQISPILKKYSQQRRSVPMAPFNSASPRKRNSTTFVKKQNIKPLPIKPKPVAEDLKEELPKDTKFVPSTSTPSAVKTEMKQFNKLSNKEPNLECSTGKKSFSSRSATLTKSRAAANELNTSVSSSVSKSNEVDTPIEAEISDEVDEEAIDDEQDLVALMAASTTICKKQQSTNKKRNRLQRDLESSLALLQPNLIENDPKREEREALFANSYLLRVTEALKADPETCETFLKALCKYQHSAKSPVKLYFELQDILKNYPGLADDFIAFLSPEQAKVCGKYKEFTMLRKIREFLRKVEIHFSNQPQHLVRILRVFAQLRLQKGITSAEVINALQSLLRNQSHLMEELSSLLPDTPPPEYLMTDFEDVRIPNSDEDNSSIDSCEEIIIPDVPDPYGGKDCPCDCHISTTETKMLNRSRHCMKCGIKFIDGRIYIQTGKVLKPAQVIYHNLPSETSTSETEKDSIPQHGTKSVHNEHTPQHSTKSVHNEHVPQHSTKVPNDTVKVSAASENKQEVPTQKNQKQKPIVACPTENLPSSSKLPCDVIEDTVFPGVAASSVKSVPSDFSHLKDMISLSNDKDTNEAEHSNASHKNQPKNMVNEVNSATAAKSSNDPASQQLKWTQDEDRLLTYNCQRFGITAKAFQCTAAILKTKTEEEVENRFIYLMKYLSKEAAKK